MASPVDDILNSLDMRQLADLVGADQSQVEEAAAAALPALFGGLDANARDPRGADSILQALGQHDSSLLDGGVDLGQVDPQDGATITRHIFGSNEDAVYNSLGGYGAQGGLGGSLFRRLLPLLAPIVMSYVMKQMTQRGGAPAGRSTSGGGLNDLLGSVLGGGSGGSVQDSRIDPNALPRRTDTTRSAGQAAGSPDLNAILQDVLGGAASSQSNRTSAPAGGGSILTDLLGGLLGGGRR